jgi:cellulose synthase/poly-beta-1,6-N-acetylglucosamine synthase-like glycosyltransferase
MNNSQLIALVLFILAMIPLLMVFVIYPLLLYVINRLKIPKALLAQEKLPTVTILIAARNGQSLIKQKLDNCFSLNYPQQLLEVIVFSDGSQDDTLSLLNNYNEPRLTVLHDNNHIGKAAALNIAVTHTTAQVLVFTDLDAILNTDALRYLVDTLQSQEVGGVCGLRAIQGKTNPLKSAQKHYIAFDSWLKQQESQLGYLTSNDGKLYAFKSVYFKPIAPGVTDDLYTALNIISQHKRFIFDPRAIANIKTPARNPRHEVSRRRRITCRSLTGIFAHRQLFNPFNFGFYSVALLINKVLRRFIPISLLLIFASNLLLLTDGLNAKLPSEQATSLLWLSCLIIQLLMYFMTAIFSIKQHQPKSNVVIKFAYGLFYFILGNVGMLLGLIDFLLNKQVIKWDPKKND